MSNFSFRQKWLFFFGLLLAFFGVTLALFNQTLLFNFLFNAQINPIFWPDGIVAADVAKFQQWIYGVLGATFSGWGVCEVYFGFCASAGGLAGERRRPTSKM